MTQVVPELPENFLKLPMDVVDDLLCREHPGVWAERKRGFDNAPFHWEWYDLMLSMSRLALLAPREHAKSTVFTENQTVWRSIYMPGTWTYIFSETGDQAKKLLARVEKAMDEVRPDLMASATSNSSEELIFGNGSQVNVAGAGKAVRNAHPDIIIGDDVLEERTTLTAYQRKKTERWWKGTISGMTHPGTMRKVRGVMRRFPPTRIFLVGTPFHRSDLLMAMKENPLYVYRRYAAEFDEEKLVDGWAVDVG